VIGLLFAAVFWPSLHRLWLKTNPFTGEANWSHSIFVPIIGLYYLFVNREELSRAGASEFIWGPILRPGRAIAAAVMIGVGAGMYLIARNQSGLIFSMIAPAGQALGVLGALVFLLDWSLATMLFGIAVYVYGIYPGRNDYLKDLGMVITLFGIVLMLNGWNAMRIAWFPVVFLVCAIPWPGLVYSWVAEPLSQMAAHIAVDVLKLTGVDAVCSGTRIIIFSGIAAPPRILNVAEACAGMRSLMTFIAVGAAIAFLSSKPLWQRIIIVVSAIPIAIFCNVMRISGQGLLDHYVSQKWSDSFAHQFVGMIMLVPAFFLIMGVGVLLEKMFIEEADEPETAVTAGPSRTATIAARAMGIPPRLPASVAATVPNATTPNAVGPTATAPAAVAPKPSSPSMVPPPRIAAPQSRPAATPVGTPSTLPPVKPAVRSSVTPPRATPPRPAMAVPPRPATAVTPPRHTMAGVPPRPATAVNPRTRPAAPTANGAGVPSANQPASGPASVQPTPKEST
jgi:exosortase